MAKFASLFYLICLISAFSVNGQTIRSYHIPDGIQKKDFSSSTIIVRLKHGTATHSRLRPPPQNGVQSLVQKAGVAGFEKAIRKGSSNNLRSKPHSLDNIYKIRLQPEQDPLKVINEFLTYPEVLYAEPYFLHKPLYIPNDPKSKMNQEQGPYLSLIKAYEAWDLAKSDTSMVIAILDTGTKLNHEDLEDNLWINYLDPINGQDDDGDGLTDNYFGYDFADDDNDPAADNDGHGVEISGISNATTNNSIGIAGIGFRSRYMPIKIFRTEDNEFQNGYEAIVYAADKGAGVINLSWGGENAFSQFGQDAIDYAVLEKDAVIVAAAGNTNDELDFYPASFNNVLSVGATNNNDVKADFSTYSIKIDLVAPGVDIYTTRSDGGYGIDQGTSYSSPLVAGAAALLRSYAPNLNAKQIMEKLRISSDDIYEIESNIPYRGLLGKGRLNILAAITDNISPSVRFENIAYDNGNGPYAYYDDTLSITGDFVNFLEPTPNLSVTLSSESPYVDILDPVFLIGNIGKLDTMSIENSPFQVVLSKDTPPETRLVFRIDYKDGFYEDFQHFDIVSSPDYTTINNGSISMTVSGNGNLGYNEDNYLQGVGFMLDGENLLNHLGLILATEDTLQVSNNALTIYDSNERDKDFVVNKSIRFFNGSVAKTNIRSSFVEVDTIPNPIGVQVDQKVITADTSMGNFIIIEYRMINTSGSVIDTLHTALLADWDLAEFEKNIAAWSNEDSLGYVYFPESDSLYAGVSLLTKQDPIHTASIVTDLGDTLSRKLKHSLVTNGVSNSGAGSPGNEQNVAQVVGGRLLVLEEAEPQTVAFALCAGRSLEEIRAQIDSARSFYQFYKSKPALEYVTFTCEGDPAVVDPPGALYDFYADVNRDSLIFSGEAFLTPPVTDPIIFYAVNKDQPYESEMMQMKAEVRSPETDFVTEPDTVFIDEFQNNHAQFQDLSKNAILWQWDFDNGFNSTVRNPSASFLTPGTYEISLYTENDLGCADSVTKPLQVLQRSPKPQIDPILVCRGDLVTIDPVNTDYMHVYSDPELKILLYEGTRFLSGSIQSDTSFFITSLDTEVESLPTESVVEITGLKPDFILSMDTTRLDIKYLLQLNNASQNAESYEWKLNDSTYSHAPDTLLDYSGLSGFELALIATDSLGCMLEHNQFIEAQKSPPPSIDVPEPLCRGDSITLIPTGGSTFFFYDDEDLDSLIYKGSSLYLDSLQISKDIFIIGMDSLYDSDTLKLSIDVSRLTADFSIEPDSLNLTEGNSVQFQSLNEEAVDWLWDFDNGKTDSVAAPIVTFTEPGDYLVFHRTKDSLNCIEQNEQKLPVVSILSIVDNPDFDFRIYPNPTNGHLTIHLEKMTFGDSRVLIYNHAGLLIFKKYLAADHSEIELQLPKLTPGLYYLQIELNDRISTKKLIFE